MDDNFIEGLRADFDTILAMDWNARLVDVRCVVDHAETHTSVRCRFRGDALENYVLRRYPHITYAPEQAALIAMAHNVWADVHRAWRERHGQVEAAPAVNTITLNTNAGELTWVDCAVVHGVGMLNYTNIATGTTTITNLIQTDYDRFMAAQRAEAKRRDEARARALDLFRSNLNKEQLNEWEQTRFFHVIGNVTGRRYRISTSGGQSFSIFEKNDSGQVVCGWCFYPLDVDNYDAFLAQKIMLESDEISALRIANPSPEYTYYKFHPAVERARRERPLGLNDIAF